VFNQPSPNQSISALPDLLGTKNVVRNYTKWQELSHRKQEGSKLSRGVQARSFRDAQRQAQNTSRARESNLQPGLVAAFHLVLLATISS